MVYVWIQVINWIFVQCNHLYAEQEIRGLHTVFWNKNLQGRSCPPVIRSMSRRMESCLVCFWKTDDPRINGLNQAAAGMQHKNWRWNLFSLRMAADYKEVQPWTVEGSPMFHTKHGDWLPSQNFVRIALISKQLCWCSGGYGHFPGIYW